MSDSDLNTERATALTGTTVTTSAATMAHGLLPFLFRRWALLPRA